MPEERIQENSINKIENNLIVQKEKISQYHCSKNEIASIAYFRSVLVPCTLDFREEEVDISYDVSGLSEFSALKNKEQAIKLRALYNVALLAEYTNKFSFLLSPNNLFYDINLMPKILNRFLKNDVHNTTETDFLLQYKALIGSICQERYTFQDYYNGGIDLLKKQKFLKDVYNCNTIKEISDLILNSYEYETKETDQNLVVMEKSKFTKNRIITIVSILLVCFFALATAYIYFMILPEKQKIIDSTYAFFDGNYSGVVKLLDIPTEKLTKENKYMLAYSFVNIEKFTDEQRANILNDVKISNEIDLDDGIFDYWIYIGRGKNEKALDIAKSINDTQLIGYALLKYEDEINKDRELSGTKKQELLADIQKQIDDLSKKINPNEKSQNVF